MGSSRSYMSPNVYAFLNAEMIVVNVISGVLTPVEVQRFERDYAILFNATMSVPVEQGVSVWIGGRYDLESGTFTPPPSPEPEPEIVEETTNAAAPNE